MKIDRRITNGLAWTGALLVVAIPSADFITRQFMPDASPSVAVVSEVRAPVAAASPSAPARSEAAAAPKAETQTVAQSGDVVDAFINSGRALPDYITGGSSAALAPKPAAQPEVKPAPKPAAPAPEATPTPAPVAPAPAPVAVAPQPAPAAVATAPQVIKGFPTPVSQRPPSVAVAYTPPLVIDTPPVHSQSVIRPSDNRVIRPSDNRVIRPEELDDMEDWERGPLQDFLNRQGSSATFRRQQIVPPGAIVPPANVGGGNDYVPGGYFLDQGPGNAQPRGFPRPYDDSGIPEYEVYPLN